MKESVLIGWWYRPRREGSQGPQGDLWACQYRWNWPDFLGLGSHDTCSCILTKTWPGESYQPPRRSRGPPHTKVPFAQNTSHFLPCAFLRGAPHSVWTWRHCNRHITNKIRGSWATTWPSESCPEISRTKSWIGTLDKHAMCSHKSRHPEFKWAEPDESREPSQRSREDLLGLKSWIGALNI